MVVTRESMIGRPRLKWLATTVIAPLHRPIATVLALAAKNGDIKRLPEPNMIQALAGAVVHYFSAGPLLKVLYNVDPLEPACVEQHTELVIDVFLHGILRR